MKILILGASGFVGRNLYEYLKKKYNIDVPSHDVLDVLNEQQLATYLQKGKYDVVINALDVSTSSDYYEKRFRMFCNLEKHNSLYGKMIYFGSGAEYARELPVIKITEEQFDRKIPEDTYGFCLHQMNCYARRSDNIYNFRLFGIFGKYELWKTRFISNAICKALYGYPITIRQDRIMDYLHIDDLNKMVDWAINQQLQYNDYNAVSGRQYALSELAEIVKSVVNADVPIYIAKEGMFSEYTASNDRLMKEMKNFVPEPIEVSIEKLVEYYKKNISEIDKVSLLYQ